LKRPQSESPNTLWSRKKQQRSTTLEDCRPLDKGPALRHHAVESHKTIQETTDEDKAQQMVEAKNPAERQLEINLQIAKAYLAAADSNFIRRTWREVMAEFIKTKGGSNRTRSECAVLDKSFDSIRDRQLIEARSEHFLRVLESGKVSKNNCLRWFHDFCRGHGLAIKEKLNPV
jgi:hypothetical protein